MLLCISGKDFWNFYIFHFYMSGKNVIKYTTRILPFLLIQHVLFYMFVSLIDSPAQLSSFFQVTTVAMNILLKIMSDKIYLKSISI